jgi:hypothetical protein
MAKVPATTAAKAPEAPAAPAAPMLATLGGAVAASVPPPPPKEEEPVEENDTPTEAEVRLLIEKEPSLKDIRLAFLEIHRLRTENVALKAPKSATPPPAKPSSKAKSAVVKFPGAYYQPLEVSYPADAKNPTIAAIDAAKKTLGVVEFGSAPEVQLLD